MAFEAPAPNPEPEAVEDGPLSIDDALGLLDGDGGDAPDGDDAPEATETPADDQAADADTAPDDDDPASEDGEDDEGDDQAQAIAPPEFWSAEEKAIFAKAPSDVQMLVAAKTAEAEKRVYSAKEEAAAARKDASVIAEISAVIDQQVERAESIFRGKWDGVDWAAWSKENPTEAFQAKLEFDQEQAELARLKTAQAATEVEAHRQFLKAEVDKLAEAKHPLADPVKGREVKQALVSYAEQAGYSLEDLKWAGAKELTTLHKAFLYDQAQARLAAKPAKQPTAAKAPGPVRPAGAPPSRRELQDRNRKSVLGKAYATGKMDDAVAALLALEG